MRNKYIRKGFMLCIFVCLLTGCQETKTQEEIASIIPETVGREIQTTVATIMDIQKTTLFDGQISPSLTEYTFSKSGILKDYYVKQGDQVKKGDILATLETSEMEEQIEKLEEEIEELKQNYEHDSAYYKQKILILTMKLDDTSIDQSTTMDILSQKEKYNLLLKQSEEKYNLESAKKESDLAELKESISKNSIIASHDGTVVYRKDIITGTYVSDIDCCLAVTNESEYYVYTDYFSEVNIKNRLRVYALKDNKEYEITYIPMDTEMYNKLKLAKTDPYSSFLVNEPDGSIQYGESAKIVIVSEEVSQVVGIPKSAIHSDTLGKYVYQKVDGNRVKTYIKIGLNDNVNTEVKEGLKEGDVIYVE